MKYPDYPHNLLYYVHLYETLIFLRTFVLVSIVDSTIYESNHLDT